MLVRTAPIQATPSPPAHRLALPAEPDVTRSVPLRSGNPNLAPRCGARTVHGLHGAEARAQHRYVVMQLRRGRVLLAALRAPAAATPASPSVCPAGGTATAALAERTPGRRAQGRGSRAGPARGSTPCTVAGSRRRGPRWRAPISAAASRSGCAAGQGARIAAAAHAPWRPVAQLAAPACAGGGNASPMSEASTRTAVRPAMTRPPHRARQHPIHRGRQG